MYETSLKEFIESEEQALATKSLAATFSLIVTASDIIWILCHLPKAFRRKRIASFIL